MRYINLVITFFLAFFISSCSSIAKSPYDLTARKIEFDLPQVQTWKMSNGIEVYFYQNDELPLVQGAMYFKGGSLNADLAGLAGATASQLRQGGTKKIPSSELNQKLNSLAASVESSMSSEFAKVSFFSLKQDFSEVLELFSEVIREPAFEAKKLSLWKSNANQSIDSRNEKAGVISSMVFSQSLYGKDSPYSRYSTKKTIAKINKNKIKDFYKLIYNPKRAYLAVSGSITKKELQEELESNFENWENLDTREVALPEINNSAKPAVYVVEKDFDQASIVIGHLGPSRQTEDKYAIKVYNELFGSGGFSSMLTKRIRTELGLAYSVYGGVYASEPKGVFQVVSGTRADQAVKAASEIIKLASSEKDFNEIDLAKSAIEKSFVFKFDDSDFIPQRNILLKIYGYEDTYDRNYLENLANVSKSDVINAENKWVKPEELCIIIVGKVSIEDIKREFSGKFDVYRVEFDKEPLSVTKY